MIKPVTREYFRGLIGNKEEYIKRPITIKTVDLLSFLTKNKDKDFPFASTDTYLYFEKPGEGVFAYIDFLKLAIIPKNFESITIDEDEIIDFSDWKLEILSTMPDKTYTINLLSYASEYHDYSYACEDLMNKLSEGNFRIKNERIGFSTDITLRRIGYWRKELLIGYPKKLEVPYNMPKLRKMDKSLRNMLIWTQSKQ